MENTTTLVMALRQGDEKAFAEIYSTYHGPLYFFIQRILNNKAETEEVAADTFVKLWRLRGNFESLQNIRSFLYVTARNASFTLLKQRKDQARRQEQLDYFLSQSIEGPSQQDEIKAEVLSKILSEAENLPLQCKRIFELSFMEGRRNADIANELGLTLQTVKNQKTTALKSLRLVLTGKEWQLVLLPIVFLSIHLLVDLF